MTNKTMLSVDREALEWVVNCWSNMGVGSVQMVIPAQVLNLRERLKSASTTDTVLARPNFLEKVLIALGSYCSDKGFADNLYEEVVILMGSKSEPATITDKLLPCPHCGSSAQLTIYSGAPAIICDNDQCIGLMGGEEYMGTAEHLIENWNRRPPILQNHGQPAAWATEIGLSEIEAASKTTWPSFVSVSSHRSNMGGITVPLFREQPAALKIGAGVTVQNVGFGAEQERKPGMVALYAAQPQGEVGRLRYKAELYDEVWELATGLGYMNVTTAIGALRAQLAERDVLLGRWGLYGQAELKTGVTLARHLVADTLAILSTSAEPKPRGEVFGYWRVPKGLPLQGMFLTYDKDRSETDIQNAIDHGFSITRLYAEPSNSGDANEMVAKVVLPERKPQRVTDEYARGWNDYDAEYKRLNEVNP